MAYVDYTYYTETYLGTAIAEADFPRAALRASAMIDALTFERAAAVITADSDTATIDKILMATCAVAEEYERIDAVNESGGEIQSERVGNHSVTYVTKSAKSDGTKLANVAALYLGSTGLMYRGVDAD